MSDASMQALAAFAESMKGMNKKELATHKKWFSQRLKDTREHEEKMAVLSVFAKDPDMKYYLGVALGAATGAAGAYVGSLTGTEQAEQTQTPSDFLQPRWWWVSPIALGAHFGTLGTAAEITEQVTSNGPDPSLDLASNMSRLLAVGGVSFAAWCASVLTLKAIFSGTDLGDMMSGLGEIIPG